MNDADRAIGASCETVRRNMCAICWRDKRPLIFGVMNEPKSDVCWYCGESNCDGIYVRENTTSQ